MSSPSLGRRASPSVGASQYDSDGSQGRGHQFAQPDAPTGPAAVHSGPAELTEEEAEAIAAYESYFHTERGIILSHIIHPTHIHLAARQAC